MFKYIFSIAILSFFVAPNSIFAQRDEPAAYLNWGEEYREPSGTYLSKVAALDGNGIYILREKDNAFLKPSEVILEYYDRQKMNLVKSRELNLKYKRKKRDFENLIMMKGNLYMFTSFNNIAKENNYLFVQKIDSEKLKAEEKFTKIAEVESVNEYKEGSFSFITSKDSSKLLICTKLPYKRGEQEQFGFQIFDQNLNLLWKKNVKLPYEDKNFGVEELQVDNFGNVYVLGIVYADGQRLKRKGKPTYQYTLLGYNDSEIKQEYKLNIKEKFITDLTFRVANNGDLICCGFYSEQGTYSIKGTYYFRVNPRTNTIENENLKEFDLNFMTEYMSDRQKRRAQLATQKDDADNEPELENISLDHLIIRSDGGALLIAEQYFVRDYTYYDGFGQMQREYIYNYNDIIVTNINSEGKIEWASRIPKRQETTNDKGYYSSYSYAVLKDKICLIYNDNPKNLNPDKDKRRIYYYDRSSSIVALTEIFQDGTTRTSPLFKNKDENIYTRPKVCRQIAKDQMLIYGERNNKYKFANAIFR